MSQKNKNNLRNRKERRMTLQRFVGEEIFVSGNFISYADGITTYGIRKTMLLRRIKLRDKEDLCDHVWIKVDDILNFEEIADKKIDKMWFTATPYIYNIGRKKFKRVKFSLKDVTIERIRLEDGTECSLQH